MMHHLVDLERKALSLQNAGKFAEAADIFAEIVREQPDWEHGTGFYNLATCYEDSGQIEKAERAYQSALRYQPAYDVFLGGYASFLYLHGSRKGHSRFTWSYWKPEGSTGTMPVWQGP